MRNRDSRPEAGQRAVCIGGTWFRASAVALAAAGLFAASTQLAQAQAAEAQEASRDYDIPPGPLSTALSRFAAEAGVLLSVDARLTEGKTSPGLQGRYPLSAGFAQLLAGTGLEAEQGADGYLLKIAPPPPEQPEAMLPTVKVTANAELPVNALPEVYAGGQVARGARVGVFGNQDFLDAPFSITSFTTDFRENIQAVTIADVLKYAVSVQTPQLGYNSQNDILFLRGFLGIGGAGSFDGLQGLLRRQAPVESLERIEVLLGPTAFTGGRVANVGGLINLAPKRAADTPLTRIGGNFISNSYLGSTVDVGRRFGTDGAFGVRVNAAYADGEAAVDDTERRATTAAIGLDYRSDRLRWSFDYLYNNRSQTPQGSERVNLAPGVPVPRAPEASRPFTPQQTGLNSYDREFSLAATRVDWQIADGWEISAAYGLSNDGEPRNNSLGDYVVINPQGDFTTTTFTSVMDDTDADSGELIVHGRFSTWGANHRINFGASRFTADIRSLFVDTTVPEFNSNLYAPVREFSADIAPISLPPQATSTSKTTGLFISDQLGFFDDRLLLILGLRNTGIETDSFNAATGARTGGFDDDALTPAVGVVAKPLPWLSVYANAVDALENGATAPSTANNAGETFPPLESSQIEVGAKADFGTFATTVALFDIDRASQFTDPRTNVFAQDGRQQNRGLELTLFGEPLAGLRLYSGLSVIDAKLRKTSGGTFDGNAAPDVPDYSLTASIDWDIWRLPGWALQGGLVRTGKQPFDNANTVTVPAWTRLDAGVRYSANLYGQKATLRFNVENLADKNYFMGDRGGLVLAAPRTFLASVTMDLAKP